MKKLSALTLSLSAYLVAALPASAQVNISGTLCPTEPNVADGEAMNFNPLCTLINEGNNIVSNIFNIIFIVVVLLATFFLIYGGIKWITSGGDKAGVEAARNMIVAALVGLVIAFLAYFIIQLVFNLFGLQFNSGNFWASLTVF